VTGQSAIAHLRRATREDAGVALGLVHFDPDSFPPETMPCLRCGAEAMLRFAGPCPACAQELRAKFHGEARVIEGDEYVPKMNVTPNAVAVKDD
jgi:hypothetical protein